MRSMKINQGWYFGFGVVDLGKRVRGDFGDRIVNLPHDYMIESDVYAEAPSAQASGYYNAGVAHYIREIDIPEDWKEDRIALRLDGAMMNVSVCLPVHRVSPSATVCRRWSIGTVKNCRIILAALALVTMVTSG